MLRRVGLLFLSLQACFTYGYSANTPKSLVALWVDSVYSVMTIEQKIGQLIVAKNESPASLDILYQSKIPAGGLSLPQGNANEIFTKVSRLKENQEVPFLAVYSQNGKFDEYFPGSIPYPSIYSKASLSSIEMLEQLEKREIETQRSLGINVAIENNFSIDIVHGEFLLKERNSLLPSKNMQMVNLRNKLLAESNILNSVNFNLSFFNYDFIKHIPKTIYESKEWGKIKNDYSIIMINSLDFKNGWSGDKFEKEVIKGLFRGKFGYDGILAIEADHIVNQIFGQMEYSAIEVELINSGFDLVITSDPVQAYKNLMYAYKMKDLKNSDLEDRVKNILAKKFYLANDSLASKGSFGPDYYSILNAPVVNNDIYEAYAGSITILKNDAGLVPVKHLETANFASLMIGANELTTFQETLEKYAPFTHFVLPASDINDEAFTSLLKKLSAFDNVVIGIRAPFNDKILKLLANLNRNTHVITAFFDASLPDRIQNLTNSLLVSYEDNEYTQQLVPQVIFGARPCAGMYQLNHSEFAGKGIATEPLGRLAFSKTYRNGFDEATLARIDKIATEAVTLGATPGCQVLVARHGNIVYDKSFGFYTYDSLMEVSGKTIYDVASITKVAATTQAIMFLADQGYLNLDEKLVTYLPELKGTNKADLIIRDVLTHQAGLQAFLPLWNQTLNVEKLEMPFYSSHPDEDYSNEVAFGMYSSPALKDSIFAWMVKSDLRRKPRSKRFEPYDYKYSDLGFYLMYALAERLLNQPMDEFLEQNLYEPLGMSSTAFNPQCKFHFLNMAPTEDDKVFRHVLVWGNVHDQIAAMNGGVSGHAGLFSNSVDLAKLGQMHLQRGSYGGQKYFSPESIKLFTSPQFEENRRGLGWDKPEFESNYNPASSSASASSFGHRGFTGTVIWVDPEYDLVYVFLSNRIYPDMSNNKLNNFDIRRRIHDAIYESIHNFDRHLN